MISSLTLKNLPSLGVWRGSSPSQVGFGRYLKAGIEDMKKGKEGKRRGYKVEDWSVRETK